MFLVWSADMDCLTLTTSDAHRDGHCSSLASLWISEGLDPCDHVTGVFLMCAPPTWPVCDVCHGVQPSVSDCALCVLQAVPTAASGLGVQSALCQV